MGGVVLSMDRRSVLVSMSVLSLPGLVGCVGDDEVERDVDSRFSGHDCPVLGGGR